MRKRVLVIGPDQYVLRACLKYDVHAVVVQNPPTFDVEMAEIPATFDLLQVDDRTSAESILTALHRVNLATEPFSAVYTMAEDAMVTAGLLADHLGCRAINPTTALYFRDKALQKRRIAEAGIACARAVVVHDIYDVSGHPDLPFDRAVLKPIAGSGTRNTFLLNDVADLRARSAELRERRVSQRTCLIEEYMSGDEWVADGVVSDGNLLFLALGKYGEPCIGMVSNELPLWMRRFDQDAEYWAYAAAEPVVRQALTALGLRDGVFHMELFHDPSTGDLTFGECAARRGGALTQEEVQSKFNVDLGECALLCALGVGPDPVVKQRPETVGGAHLHGRPGTLISCPTPAELMRLPNVEYARIQRPFGSHIPAGVSSTGQRFAQVLVTADSEEQLFRRFTEIGDWLDERLLVIPQGATMQELRSWHEKNWPDADFRDALLA